MIGAVEAAGAASFAGITSMERAADCAAHAAAADEHARTKLRDSWIPVANN